MEQPPIDANTCENSDHDLKEIVDLIVSNFDGDTTAFFESIKPQKKEPSRAEIIEAVIARKFAKLG